MRNVLSLFNGMSCLNIALERIGLEFENYYSSEIDKYAIQVTQNNYPDTIQLGDVTKWREWDIDWSSIDLVTGGFPCQAWSMAGKQLGDKDERGMLFWVMLDIMKEVKKHNPKAHFLIENVKMKKEFEQYITHHTEQVLGVVHKILINSALVSAQNRNRYYWTSFECSQPEDKGITYKSITEDIPLWIPCVVGTSKARYIRVSGEKFGCLTANYFKGVLAAGRPFLASPNLVGKELISGMVGHRMLTPIECERLQTVPDNYTSSVSNTQRYKMLGNGWTVDVIAHLLIDMVMHQ